MARISHPYDCGCNDCENGTKWRPVGETGKCCTHCPDTPCEYLVLWGCTLNYFSDLIDRVGSNVSGTAVPTSGTNPDYLIDHISFTTNFNGIAGGIFYTLPTMGLRRECSVANCDWTWRRKRPEVVDACLTSLLGFEGDGVMAPTWQVPVGDLSRCQDYIWVQEYPPVRKRYVGTAPPSGTGQGEYVYDKIPYGCDDRQHPMLGTNPYNIHQNSGCQYFNESGADPVWYGTPFDRFNLACCIAWKMSITSSTTAILTGYANPGMGFDGVKIEYECNNFDCAAERNTFTRTDIYTQVFSMFPPYVCIAKGYSDLRHPCTDRSEICSCCDDGRDLLYLELDALDCLYSSARSIFLERYYDSGYPGITPPSGIGSCGWFGGVLFNGYIDPGTGIFIPTSALLIIAWCDGSSWTVQIYCLKSGIPYLICGNQATVISCCPTARLLVDCPELTCASPATGSAGDCCDACGGTVTTLCCSGNPLPDTLHATITSSIINTTITLTYDPTITNDDFPGVSIGGWRGTFSILVLATPTSYFCTHYFSVYCQPNTPPDFAVEITQAPGSHANCAPCFTGLTSGIFPGSCNPLSIVVTGLTIPASCPYNSTGSDVTLDITITV